MTGRARRTDPATSHAAADASFDFSENHKDIIEATLRAITAFSCLGATAHEIEAASGLTVVQIDRRLTELGKEGKAFVVQYNGADLERGRARAWDVTEHKVEPEVANERIRAALFHTTVRKFARHALDAL
jgi:HD superfamily phosphodiesterase